ncbi:MAG: NmrA family NAD(P)-binding protein [Candidatus Izemoplasmataceae bacterium]
MILLIGSTGNIGKHVVSYLKSQSIPIKEAIYQSKDNTQNTVNFDFLDASTFENALKGVRKVFFIRPPQLGNPSDLYPFLDYCKTKSIDHIVFVSLMGVEKNPIPPHAKIEKYIKKIKLPYTFIRPSFFMENLIYPHGDDIKSNNKIIVPALKSKTSFIACKDIGYVCGETLIKSPRHINHAYTLTGPKALDYNQVATTFSKVLNRKITYTNPKMKAYTKHMIQLGFDKDYVKITKLLYFMTRLGTAKKITSTVESILKRPATTLEDFIKENKQCWL